MTVVSNSVAPVYGADSGVLSVSFSFEGDAHPGLAARVLEPFAKRDLIPDSLVAERLGEKMRFTLVCRAIPAEMVHLVAGNLGQVVGVRKVDTVRMAEPLRRVAA